MSFSTIYSESFRAYENRENISNAIQKKVDQVADNEMLFGTVDYSSAYDKVNQSMQEQLDAIKDEEANGEGGTGATGGAGTTEDGGTIATEEQMQELRAAYEQVQDEQGWVGKAWNGIKNFFGHDNGSNAIEEVLDKAESGEISYEEAVEKLNNYATKQDSIVDTFANVASGVAAAASLVLAVPTLGASVAVGAGVSAAVKVGIKATDAATNEIEGDYSLKDGLKDGVTGAVGGAVTVATAGIGTSGLVVKEGGKVLVKETIKQGAIAGAKAGAIDGAVMGATNYTADAVFDGDEFTLGGLASNTVTSAAAGATIGGLVGGTTAGLSARGANKAAAKAATKEAGEAATKEAGEAATKEAGEAATKEAGEAVGKEAGEAATKEAVKTAGVEDEMYKMFKQNRNLDDMTAEELSQLFTGKANSNGYDVVKAYDAISETKAFAENKEFKAYVMDAFTEYTTKQTAKAATKEAGEAATKEAGEGLEGLEGLGIEEMFEQNRNLDDMTAEELSRLFTGKANADGYDVVKAYDIISETKAYAKNKEFKAYVMDAFAKYTTKQTAKAATKEAGEAVGKEAGEAVGKEAGEAATKEAGEAVGKEAGEAATKEAGEAVTKEAGEAVGKEATETVDEMIEIDMNIPQNDFTNLDNLTDITTKTGLDDKSFTAGYSELNDATNAADDLLQYNVLENNLTKTKQKQYNNILSEKDATNTTEDLLKYNVLEDDFTRIKEGEYNNILSAEKKTVKEIFGDMVSGARTRVSELFKRGTKVKDMTPEEIRQAFTGKANATASEFKEAYEAMKKTGAYRTNLMFRTFLEDAFNVGSAE